MESKSAGRKKVLLTATEVLQRQKCGPKMSLKDIKRHDKALEKLFSPLIKRTMEIMEKQ